ncbi:MAG: hypothetical protein AAGA90_05945 [Actinomycetota bacterium]
MSDKTTSALPVPVMVTIGIAGGAIRLRQFFGGRGLWHDEAKVANELSDRSMIGLVTEASPRGQMAPPGFWIAEKVMSVVSFTAPGLRLVPLVFGLALIGMVIVYAHRHLATWPAQLALVAAVAFSPSLIHYSAEVKQYVGEAAMSMLLVFAVVNVDRWSPWVLAGVAAFALLFSIPALVLVPVLGMLYLGRRARSDGLDPAIRAIWLPASLLVVVEAVVALSIQSTRVPIEGFWEDADAYAPFPLTPSGVGWLFETAARTARFSLYHEGMITRPADASFDTALWAVTGVVATSVVAAGAALAWRRRSDADAEVHGRVLAVLLTLGVVMVGLSVVDLYPMHGRLTIYAFPLVFLLAAHSIELIGAAGRRWVAPALGGALAVAALPVAIGLAVEPNDRWDIVQALDWIEGRPQPGDAIAYPFAGSGESYDFHRVDYDFGSAAIRNVTNLDAEEIAVLGDGGTVWFFSAFVIPSNEHLVDEFLESELVVDHLRGDGLIVAQLVHPDASE